MTNHEIRLISLMALLVSCSCTTMNVQKPETEDPVAVRAQMAVKAALLDEEQVAAAPVRVKYEDGSVRLTGFVETEAEKQRATEVAERAVPDVEIVNDLEVWRPSGSSDPYE